MDLQWFPSNFIPGVEAVVVVLVVVVDDVVDVEVVAVGVMPVLGGISNHFFHLQQLNVFLHC